MGAPLVSVVVPTRNRAELVERAVASIVRQSWSTWEAIVVDDASTDTTQAVLDGIAERDPRVRVVRNETATGGSAARNRGIELAEGELLAFLDDDDEWLPTKLAAQVEFLLAQPSVGAVSCWHTIDDDSPFGPAIYRGPTDITLDDLYWDNFLGSASFLVWRRAAFSDEPRFDPAMPSAQDWDVWLQCADRAAVAVVPQVLCRYAAHAGPRIAGSAAARIDGRRKIVEHHRTAMSDSCIAFNRARIELLDGEDAKTEASVLADLVRHGHTGAAWALTSAAVAGRLGDRARDPGRGARQLHRVITRLRS